MDVFVKTVKFIINSFLTVIIIIGSIFIILFAVGIQPYVVESGSMEPEIKTGSVCFINKKSVYEDMHVGDIIAFELPGGKFATHRITQITENGFITKGDANGNVDSITTTKDNFIGKNLFSIPHTGFLIKKLQSKSGRIIFITIIIVLLVAGIILGESGKKKE